MKAVLDAVNEFKGDFPYESPYASLIRNIDGNIGFSDYYGTGNSTPNSNWYKVCSREEFNECVKECSNNFGRCVVTWDEHKEYWRKIQLEQACKMARAELMEAQPTKPIYTKAMSNHNILPRVGMECIGKRFHQSDNQFKHCFIIGKNKKGDYLVFERNSKIEQHNISNGVWEFKPVDMRSDKERAIDDLIKDDFPCGVLIDRKLLGVAYDKWVK